MPDTYVRQLARIFVILLAIGVSLSCQSSYQVHGEQHASSISMPDVRLVTQADASFAWPEDVTADVALVFLGYTYCPDVCPTTLAILQTMLADMPTHHQERIQVILISADPERDTPAELANYLSFFSPDFMGLTGEPTEVQRVVSALGAFAEKDLESLKGTHYLVSHTARLYVVRPDGQVSLSYPFGFDPDDLQQDLTYLLEQE